MANISVIKRGKRASKARARILRLKVEPKVIKNRIVYGGVEERIRARGRTRADARAHAEADAVFFRLVRGLQILLTVHGAGALPGYGPLGQILALLISLLFRLLFCCLVCWSVCPSLIGHPTRVRFPVLSTGPLPTPFPPFHPLHTSFSLFIELWSCCGRRHPR